MNEEPVTLTQRATCVAWTTDYDQAEGFKVCSNFVNQGDYCNTHSFYNLYEEIEDEEEGPVTGDNDPFIQMALDELEGWNCE